MQWGRLTADDLLQIDGNLESFQRTIHTRYGDQADTVSQWFNRRYARWIGWYEGVEEPAPSKMRKIVITRSYGDQDSGGFCLSHQAFLRLRELGQADALREVDGGAYWPLAASPLEPSFNRCGALIPRDDEKLIHVVEELGAAANGHAVELKIVEIPAQTSWKIEQIHGREHVSEVHRTWH
jgi:hypothetical protein